MVERDEPDHRPSTNTNIIVLGFATNSMGMEWKYGSHGFQERFTPHYIRSATAGAASSHCPDGICPSGTGTEYCTMLIAAAHEVRPTCPGHPISNWLAA